MTAIVMRFPVWLIGCPIDYAIYSPGTIFDNRRQSVKNALSGLKVKCRALRSALKQEAGQDLVEYAAIITVIVLGLIVGMGTLANGINNAMTTVSGRVNTAFQSST